jgi:hypothetical protein
MPFHIGFLLFPNITQLDLTGPYEVFTKLPYMRVRMSMVYAVCFSRCKWWRVGTLLGPGLSCLAAMAASPYMRSGH